MTTKKKGSAKTSGKHLSKSTGKHDAKPRRPTAARKRPSSQKG